MLKTHPELEKSEGLALAILHMRDGVWPDRLVDSKPRLTAAERMSGSA